MVLRIILNKQSLGCESRVVKLKLSIARCVEAPNEPRAGSMANWLTLSR